MAQFIRTLIYLLVSVPVWALPDDRQQAIEINADEAVINEQANIATYRGRVDVSQGSFRLQADRLEITLDGAGAVNTLNADGQPARFESKRQAGDREPVRGEARALSYSLTDAAIVLLGDAKIQLDGSEFQGPEIRYNTETGEVTGTGTTARRVQMIFVPKPGRP